MHIWKKILAGDITNDEKDKEEIYNILIKSHFLTDKPPFFKKNASVSLLKKQVWVASRITKFNWVYPRFRTQNRKTNHIKQLRVKFLRLHLFASPYFYWFDKT